MATAIDSRASLGPKLNNPENYRNFAWLVLIWNGAVALWGAYVRASGSGAGCGSHWPLCNGEVIPRERTAALLVEFSHRLTSGVSAIAVVAMCLWAFRLFPEGDRQRRLTAWGVVLIFVEALLGAGLVLFRYVDQNASVGRAIYLSLHLSNTLFLLGVLACVAWLSWNVPSRFGWREIPWPFWSLLPVALLVGISGAVAALGDTLFPPASLKSGLQQDFSATAHFLVRLRIVHPFVAAVGGLLFATIALFALRITSNLFLRRLSVLIVALTAAQLCAGMLNLVLLAPVWMQLVHLTLAYSLWIALVLFVVEAASPYPRGQQLATPAGRP